MPVNPNILAEAEKTVHPYGRGLKGVKGELMHNKVEYGVAGAAGVPFAVHSNRRRSTHQGINQK